VPCAARIFLEARRNEKRAASRLDRAIRSMELDGRADAFSRDRLNFARIEKAARLFRRAFSTPIAHDGSR
jgi:hypothetical protein